ncbi:hypothetical protein [Demequina lutea]|uniref:Uncharacterized protein n=1 Tax=Demequina lutea TaxID=431489 RepID=A0A7Y9ZAT4_9MICO|nr:hypothetical protein [Demequina lutea]NYI41964.1 hypothetical protein [Demequina lutea]
MAHEGVLSEPLSDEEQVVLRALARDLVRLPQDLVVAPGPEHGLPRSEDFNVMPPSDTPQRRMRIGDLAEASVRRRVFDHLDGVDLRMAAAGPSRICETDTAPHNPEWKLS